MRDNKTPSNRNMTKIVPSASNISSSSDLQMIIDRYKPTEITKESVASAIATACPSAIATACPPTTLLSPCQCLNEYAASVPGLVVHPSASSRTKRLIDILGAAVGIGITAVVAIPVAIAMQLDSPGPIFYGQIRCGLNGRTFRIWKFRSMVVGAEKMQHLVKNEAQGQIFKNSNDPRITRVGRFLRRTSLDELPQFWNVLRGEMSLVGTRPPTVNEVKQYVPLHWQRLQVKPGITGEWQVNGRSSVKDFEAIVGMDLEYQRKWSVTYDLYLLFKTLQAVLNKRGAY